MKVAAVKQAIYDEAAAIVPLDDLEREQIADALHWISSGINIFRIESPDKPPKHLVAYFVVVDVDHRSILLGDHIKAQLWLPSGGHVGLNELPADTVRREIEEELFIKAVFLKGSEAPFFLTSVTTVGLTPGHTDVSLWYLLKGSIHDKLRFDRAEYNDMSWFTFDEILSSHPSIFDPHLQRFARKLNDFVRN